MKINEVAMNSSPLNDSKIAAAIYFIEIRYGKDSEEYKKAIDIIDSFFNYDDPVVGKQTIIRQLLEIYPELDYHYPMYLVKFT